MIQGRTKDFDRSAQALAIGLVVCCGAFLTACTGDQDTPAAEGQMPTVAIAAVPADSQPTQEVARPGTTSTSTSAGTAGSSLSDPPVKVVTTISEVVGLVTPSLAPESEPPAEHMTELIEVVQEHGAPAVFGEATVSERLVQAGARETGAELVQPYSGSMGVEGSGADTYLGMVRTNVERTVEALK